jgi:hypothetical protein
VKKVKRVMPRHATDTLARFWDQPTVLAKDFVERLIGIADWELTEAMKNSITAEEGIVDEKNANAIMADAGRDDLLTEPPVVYCAFDQIKDKRERDLAYSAFHKCLYAACSIGAQTLPLNADKRLAPARAAIARKSRALRVRQRSDVIRNAIRAAYVSGFAASPARPLR